MLLPVSFVGVVIFVTLIDFESIQVQRTYHDRGLDFLARANLPGLDLQVFMEGSEHSLRLSPDEVVLFGLHAQKV